MRDESIVGAVLYYNRNISVLNKLTFLFTRFLDTTVRLMLIVLHTVSDIAHHSVFFKCRTIPMKKKAFLILVLLLVSNVKGAICRLLY